MGKDVQWPRQEPGVFSLMIEPPIATIDYGSEAAGYAFFNVSAVKMPVQIEMKYSEPFDGLQHVWGDGPFTYATSLANAVRVEMFNVTKTGTMTSSLIQGGQRWLSIRLTAGNSVSISQIGFLSTVSVTQPDELPTQFQCDDPVLNEIWKLGQKAATMVCLEKDTQKAVWDIDPVKGAFVHSTRSSPNVETGPLQTYTLEFETPIERSEVW